MQEHEEAVAHFAAAAKEGRNAELQAYAAKILPTLHEPPPLARDLAAEHR